MKTIFDLESVANTIKEASGGTMILKKKFEGSADEYHISNVTEEILTNLGFEFKGYTLYGNAPYYEKENILAYFDDVILHVMNTTESI